MGIVALLTLLTSLGWSQVWAPNDPRLQGQNSSESGEPVEPRRFDFQATLTASESLHDFSDPNRAQSIVWTLAPGIRLGEVHRLTLSAGVLHDFRVVERETQFTNGRLSLWRTPIGLTQGVSLLPSVGVRLPFNERSFNADSLVFGLQADTRLIVDFSAFSAGPFLAIGGVTGIRNLHTFDTSTTGASNSAWEMRESLTVVWNATSWLSFFVSGDLSHTWTYQNEPRSFFELGEGVQFQISPVVSFAVGHSNSGNTLRANGQDTNVALYDPNASSVYGSLSVTY